MNALLVSPRHADAFWSRPVSLRLTRRRAGGPPLGLLTVAALLPRAWRLRLVDLNARRLHEADWKWAELVIVSGMLGQRDSLLEIVRVARSRGKRVVAGGVYPWTAPEEVLDAGADLVAAGEAEALLPELLEALASGRRGVVRESGKPDLADSPVPRFDLLRVGDYLEMAVQTSRGCPHDCEFCDVIHQFGRRLRHKRTGQVLAELDALYALGYRGDVFFVDDNFIGDRRRTVALLHELVDWQAAHGEPFGFTNQATVDLGKDLPLIDLLTAANFGQVFIGFESPDEAALIGAGKRHSVGVSAVEAVRTIQRNGLTVLGSFIIGLDGESAGVDRRIVALVEESAMPIAMLNVLQAPPGSALWDRLSREGRLHEGLPTQSSQALSSPNFEPSRPVAEIEGEAVRVWDELYEPGRFLARAYRWFAGMRPTRAASARASKVPEPSGVAGRRVRRPRLLHEVGALLLLTWWLGVRSPRRGQFWAQLLALTPAAPWRGRARRSGPPLRPAPGRGHGRRAPARGAGTPAPGGEGEAGGRERGPTGRPGRSAGTRGWRPDRTARAPRGWLLATEPGAAAPRAPRRRRAPARAPHP